MRTEDRRPCLAGASWKSGNWKSGNEIAKFNSKKRFVSPQPERACCELPPASRIVAVVTGDPDEWRDLSQREPPTSSDFDREVNPSTTFGFM
jgi:hypothetical protein